MSEKTALAFRKLVATMRFTEKQFWETRDKKLLRKSIELEGKVDGIIKSASGKDVPENKNGNFFLSVAELRVTTKEYFEVKKGAPIDKDKVKELFGKIKQLERKVDKQLERFKDEEARKNGYIVMYHVMERLPKQKARSIFKSIDEDLVNAELNDYLRRATKGTMYFMAKTQEKFNPDKSDK